MATIRADQDNFTRDPSRWAAEGSDQQDGTAALLVGAVLTPDTPGFAGVAVIAAFATNWAVEAARLRRTDRS